MAWPDEAGSIASVAAPAAPARPAAAQPAVFWLPRKPTVPLVICSGGQVAAGTHGDALRLKVASVEVRHLTAVGTIPGVAILAAAGRNGPGVGRIRSTGSGSLLQWRAPGSAVWGDARSYTADGTGLLEDGEDRGKWIRIQIWSDWLRPSACEAQVLLADVWENGVSSDDVTAAEASAGDVEDYEITLANDSAWGLSQMKCWLDPVSDGLEISSDGVNYYHLTAEENPLALADVPAGGSITLYLRRTVSAGAAADAGVLSRLNFRWEGM